MDLGQWDLEDRRSVWVALSDLYVDNELQDFQINYIASEFLKSPYSLQDIWKINKQEVFPVLKWNYLAVAGNWTGFDEASLVEEISKRLKKRSYLRNQFTKISFFILRGYFKDDWEKVVEAYLKLDHIK